jgi:hypothetical protein
MIRIAANAMRVYGPMRHREPQRSLQPKAPAACALALLHLFRCPSRVPPHFAAIPPRHPQYRVLPPHEDTGGGRDSSKFVTARRQDRSSGRKYTELPLLRRRSIVRSSNENEWDRQFRARTTIRRARFVARREYCAVFIRRREPEFRHASNRSAPVCHRSTFGSALRWTSFAVGV